MKLDKKSILRQQKLRSIPYDKMTPDDIAFLKEQYIINGVGPESYGRCIRWLMTRLFSTLKFERHDVGYWQQIGFHLANWGILKHSFISLADEYRQICKQGVKKVYLIPKFYILLMPKVIIILLGYNAVESKKGKKAYDDSI